MIEGVGLAARLGYQHRTANRPQKIAQGIGQTRVGAAILKKLQPPLDRLVHRLSGGKSNLTEWLGGLPVLWLTVKGAKSGELRTTPLIGVPFGPELALLGTSYGSSKSPAWVYNLTANVEAVVRCGETEVEVIARRASDSEASEIWRMAPEIYGGYAKYRQRITDREIAVFILEPAASE